MPNAAAPQLLQFEFPRIAAASEATSGHLSPADTDFAAAMVAARAAVARLRETAVNGDSECPEREAVLGASQLLQSYSTDRPSSHLFRLLRLASRFRDSVDRILVLANAGQQELIQVLLDSCCDPYFNQLSRGQRGSRPRITLISTPFDVDDAEGVVQLLGKHPGQSDVESQWGLIAMREHDGQPELDHAMEFFTEKLWKQFGTVGRRDRCIVIAQPSDPWHASALRQDCQAVVEPRYSPLHRWGATQMHATGILMVAGLLGIDLVKLLAGASHVGRQFLDTQETEHPSEPFVEAQVACRLCSSEAFPEYRPDVRALHSYAIWCERQYRAIRRGSATNTGIGAGQELAGAGQSNRLAMRCGRPMQPMPLQTIVHVERWRYRAPNHVELPLSPGLFGVTTARGCRTTRICLPCVHEGTIGQLLAVSLLAMAAEFPVHPPA
ncbi:MAG: hypothetical protein FJ295_01660 [Planctomycetes bacterium]|nr:hypothetical protein [Planctomycetota bacterium]